MVLQIRHPRGTDTATHRRTDAPATALALVLLAVFAVILPVVSQSPPPVKFGASADFSGAARAIATSYHAGIRIAFDEINVAGGYNGRHLQLIAMDDQYVVANTLSNLQAIKTAHPDVVAFMASTGTANVRGSIAWATNNSIGLFFPASGAEALRNPFVRVVPNMVASYFAEASFAIRLATQVLKVNRVAIVYQNDAFGEPPANQARLKLRDMGLQPHVMAHYPTGSMNMTGVVDTLFSKATLPQAVILFTFGPQTSLVIRDYQVRTQYPTKFILISVADMVNLQSILGSSGVYENVYLIRTAPDPNDSSLQISQRFNAAANLYNNTVYREHYTMLGYMAGYTMMQILTRHDSRTNLTSASFLDVVYNTGVFNVMGLTVGPFSDVSQSPCNQGLRQLWLAQATRTGWRSVSTNAGLASLLEPWPNMCIFQDKKSRLPSIWGLGLAPQETSQLAKDFVAGVKASVRYFNEIEGGGLSNIVIHVDDLDWKGSAISGENPSFVSNDTTASVPAPTNAIQRFVREHNPAGIIGSSHLSVAGSSEAGDLPSLLNDLGGRPIMGILGGDAPFHDSPATTQLVPHRASYMTDFFGLLDALYIHRSLKRIGLLCVTADGSQFLSICSQARRAFETMNMVPAFAKEWLLTPSAPLLEDTIANLPLQDDMSLSGAVDAIIYVGPNLQSFSQVVVNLVALKRNVTLAVGSYLDTSNAFIPAQSPPILQVHTVPPRDLSKYSSLYAHTDAIGAALSIAPAVRETSGFLQGVVAMRTLIRGISSLADPENGASFIRASLLNREYLLFDTTEKPIRVGPYLDPLTSQCSQPTNASTCAQAFCRQGLTSVFIQARGSPASSTEEYAYPSCGTPPSAAQRVRMPECQVRHAYGRSVWADIHRSLRFSYSGTIVYTVVIAGLFLLLFGSALLGLTLFKFRERKLKRERTQSSAKHTASALLMGAPSSSRPVLSPNRSASRNRGSASAASAQQAKGGTVLPTSFAGASGSKMDGKEPNAAKKDAIVMIRPSTANYIALLGIVADFVTFTYLFLPARIPWVNTFVHSIMGMPRTDTVVSTNWFGLFFAYLYLVLVLCLANKTILTKLQLHAPLVFVLASYVLPMYNWLLLPIVKDLLLPFSIVCTQNKCFLDDDCTGLVWNSGHWTTAIVSAVALWTFVPTYAFFSHAWWKIQHHLDIIEANWMTLTMTWLKVTLVTLNTVLPHHFWEVQIAQVLAMIALLALVHSPRKSTNVKWWPIVQSVGVGCALISSVFGLVGETLGTRDPTAFLSALVPMWALVFLGGFYAVRRRYRSVIIPRAREHRRLQSRFAKIMAFNTSDASATSYASSDDSSGGDSSSIHSIGGLTKASVQTIINWLMALEKNKVLTAPETSWMLSDADKRRHGFVNTMYTAAGGDVSGTVEKFQKALMEQPAIESVRAALKAATADTSGTVRFDTVMTVRAESHAAFPEGSSVSQLLPGGGGRL